MFLCLSVGWVVNGWVGWLADCQGWFVLRLVCRSVGWSRSAGRSVIGLIISCAAYLFHGLVRLDGCLVGWLCWLVGQLLGCRIV